MKINTQIEFNLTISNITSIYSKNYDGMIIKEIKNLYEKKCLDNQFIYSINKLVKRSLPNLIKRDLDAKVRIYVIVEATVIRYDTYDTINNMKIDKIIPRGKIGPIDLLECSNDHCRALIKLSDKLSEFKIGDTVPIKVGTIMFKINSGTVLVTAYPFAPHKLTNVAFSIKKITLDEKEQITNILIPMLQSQLEKQEEVNKTRWNYFDKLVYPYTKDLSKKVTNLIPFVTFLESIENYEDKYVMVDQKVSLSAIKIREVTRDTIAKDNTMVLNELTMTALTKLTFTYVKHLEILYELSSIYKTDTMFEQHQYLWDLYESNKFEE